jgi:hypothetical protein
MYITDVLTKSKNGEVSHRCVLLREAYRENGKVKNRTIANLTHSNPKEVSAMRIALKHKDDLTALKSHSDVVLKQGMSIGVVWLLYEIAKRLGIVKALGNDHDGKLALWQIMARIIDQGSRLSAIRLAQTHAGCDVIGISQEFNEEHLYKNLAWISDNQKVIEKNLFKARHKDAKAKLFLYDVTSSYFEGLENELSDWGYNRDKKSGKKQVVIGLLCDEFGEPVSVEVFTGNTRDFDTLGSQIKKAAEIFGCERVTFVGDRGMIKSSQIDELNDKSFNYITAITKPQIEKLLKINVLQMSLFEDNICEVEQLQNRYILRRNPIRASEIATNRKEKQERIEKIIRDRNLYLSEHPKAKVETALKVVIEKIKRFKTDKWLKVESETRMLKLVIDEDALSKEAMLDGCYVIKSNLNKDVDKQIIHDRYKDLAMVEEAFRTMKTGILEIRPWYVKTEKSTRGHAVVVMLAYLITHYLKQAWAGLDITVNEGLAGLSMLCSMEVVIKDKGSCHHIPTPRLLEAELLKAVNVSLPKVLPHIGTKVVSRKKLSGLRQTP